MEIKLVRTDKSKYQTRGTLFCADKTFGYTIEPAHVSCVENNELSALPEGTYAVMVKNNPMAGTPCIKLIGLNIPANASIRCCNTSNKNNPSITLVSSKDASGDFKSADQKAWFELLGFLLENKAVSLVIV